MTSFLRRRRHSSRYVFDTSSLTLFASMTVQPELWHKKAYDKYIRALQACGAWTLLDEIHLFATHTSQAAVLNIKNPGTFNAALTATPTFTAFRDFTTNGTDNQILLLNPSTAGGNYAQNSASFGFRSRTTSSSNGSCAGGFDGTDGVTIAPFSTTGAITVRINQAASVNSAAGVVSTAEGLYILNRSASNAWQCRKNGASLVTGTTVSTALNDMRLRLGGISDTSFVAHQYASAYVGGNLGSVGAPVHTGLYAAELDYMQTVGAV